MNCNMCMITFNLINNIPYSFNCCGDNVCQQCCLNKLNEKGILQQCPLCHFQIHKEFSSIKPNKFILNQIQQYRQKKAVCNNHQKKISMYSVQQKQFGCQQCFIGEDFDMKEIKYLDQTEILHDIEIIRERIKEIADSKQSNLLSIDSFCQDQKINSNQIKQILDLVNEQYCDYQFKDLKFLKNFIKDNQQILQTQNQQVQECKIKQELQLKNQEQKIKQLIQEKEILTNQKIQLQLSLEYIKQQQGQQDMFQSDFLEFNKQFSLLNEDDNYQKLKKLFNTQDFKLNILYKASRDGFKKADFHSRCDNQGKTVVIIKSEHEQVFGGYADKPWNSTQQFINGVGESFIFQLNKNTKHRCKNSDWELYADFYCGPIFGYCDIGITDESNINKSYSNLGYCYELPYDYQYDSNDSKCYLAGSYEFKVLEIEVYLIQF